MNKVDIVHHVKKVFLLLLIILAFLPGVCLAIEVESAVICTGIQNRQPIGESVSFVADVSRVFCWSKIRDAQGSKIKHIYYHNAQEMAVVELSVDSPLFRTYSSKNILPIWTGPWRVDIVDGEGTILKSLDFTINKDISIENEIKESAGDL